MLIMLLFPFSVQTITMLLYLELMFGIKITDPATDSGTETYELRTHHFSRAEVGGVGGLDP